MNVARITISMELLLHAMGLPKSATILQVQMSDRLGDLVITIEHPDLKDVQSGQLIPMIKPLIQQGEDGKPEFLNWGQSQ